MVFIEVEGRGPGVGVGEGVDEAVRWVGGWVDE